MVLNAIHAKKFHKEIKKRKECNIFDYSTIAQPLPYVPIEKVIENNYYGIGRILADYSGIKKDTNTYIEHGIFFGPIVVPCELDWNVRKIVVPSMTRLKHIRDKKICKEVIVVGPYIHYADSLLSSNELSIIKKSLGKTLLVFPSHSIMNVSSGYDIDTFVAFLKTLCPNYDTILISLYWLDALNVNLVKKYESYGFKIVCAGNRFDPLFLNRLKSIILLSDDTISNDIGTHVGYAILMNKSHYIYNQNISYVATNDVEAERFRLSMNKEGQETNMYNFEVNEVKDTFSKFTPNCISDNQKKVVDKYWGTSRLMDKESLRKKILK